MQALLIIDVQNDYFPGEKSELVCADEALGNIKSALESYRAEQLPVIFIQHINTRAGATFFLPDTDGTNIHLDITPQEGETVAIKHTANGFTTQDYRNLCR